MIDDGVVIVVGVSACIYDSIVMVDFISLIYAYARAREWPWICVKLV
jgi:hypothetical protein